MTSQQQSHRWGVGIRTRVFMPLLVICMLLVLSGGWLIQRSQERHSREQVQARAATIAHAISHLAETTHDRVELQRFVAAMSAEKDVKLIVVACGVPLTVVGSSRVDWQGKLVSDLPDPEHIAKDLIETIASNEQSIEFEHDEEKSVDFSVPLRTRILADHSLSWARGAVMLHLDGLPQMQQQAASTARLLSALFGAMTIAAVAGYRLLSKVVLRPVKQIAAVTRQVAEGDCRVRVNNPNSDELGQLAADVDAMLDELVRREHIESQAKEEAIRCQQEMESALAELACSNFALDQHAIVAMTDLHGTITYVNDKFCEISQYSRKELIGANHRIVNSGHHPRSFWTDMWHTVFQGKPWHAEVCNRAKDGSLYWVDTNIVPYRDQTGQITKLVAIRTDISARKSIEGQLRESQERYELAVRGSNDGIWDWEVGTNRVYYSLRFKELLEYSDDEFPNHIDSFSSHLHPDDAQATWEAVREHLEEARPYDVTYRLRTKSGTYRWFRAKGIATRTSEGKPYRMAGSISDISAIKRIEEHLAKEATHDRLTGLPNRALLMERLEQTIHNAKGCPNHRFALLFLDFDRFKLINDSLGHDAGDELLRQIADRLRDHANWTHANQRKMSVTNARLGGDEFVLLLDNVVDVNSVQVSAERLLVALSKPYWLAEQEVNSTASIGIVMGSADYAQAEQVVRDADMAMYEAKRSGKACYVVFDEDMQRKMKRRLNLEIDLRPAIDMERLHLEFEPIVDLQTAGVQAVEAHVCWEHPGYGSIDKDEINSLAEASGVAHQLTKWTLDAACQEIFQLKQLGSLSPKTLNLNLTPKQFGLPNLPQMVFAALNKYRLPGSCLRFEITEAAFVGNTQEATRRIECLRSVGIGVAIDHFGVGTSSLSSLHQLPVDLVKIDRSMLCGLHKSKQAASLIHGLAVIVRNLGISLVAEGIEASDELIALQDLGCDLAQGGFFGWQMKSKELAEFLLNVGNRAYEVRGASPFAMRWAGRLAGESLVDNLTWIN